MTDRTQKLLKGQPVVKLADIVDNRILLDGSSELQEWAVMLLKAAHDCSNPPPNRSPARLAWLAENADKPGYGWTEQIASEQREIAEAVAARAAWQPYPGAVYVKWTLRDQPIPLYLAITRGNGNEQPGHVGSLVNLVVFRDRLFLVRTPRTAAEGEQLLLHVQRAVYEEDHAVARLRAAVANYEAVASFSAGTRRRMPIPEDVKLLVWTRDAGACVRCGAREQLQVDHVIPHAKGGADTEGNLQLLCQPCNLRKSDAITSDHEQPRSAVHLTIITGQPMRLRPIRSPRVGSGESLASLHAVSCFASGRS